VATIAHLSKQVCLDRNVIGTTKGAWLIRVNAVLETEDADNAALQLVLENLSEETGSENRRLYLVVPTPSLDIPQERVAIAHHIRRWVETTSGNGFLDLAGRQGSSRLRALTEYPRGKERGGVGFGPPPGDGDRQH
jgi:hypothetical protein